MKREQAQFHLPLIKQVGLRVRDRERMAGFYRQILGLEQVRADARETLLGGDTGQAQLRLVEVPGARPRRPHTTGLYHTAFLFPSRRVLAEKIALLAGKRWPLHGLVDHGVSQALYLSDPEGNGVELAVDKPYEEWPLRGGRLAMFTEPLSLERFVREGLAEDVGAGGTAPIIGHLHLTVGTLEEAEDYFVSGLGLKVTQDSFPGALFFARGDYHHHFAANTWAGAGTPPPPPDTTGLIGWELADGVGHTMP